ncbi:MAG: alpha/beta hydrolase [Pseudomonadota bacterium]
MFPDVVSAAKSNPYIATLSRFVDMTLALEGDTDKAQIRITSDGVSALDYEPGRACDLVLTASSEAWRELASPAPQPGFQTLSAMRRVGHLSVSGEHLKFHQNLMLLELLFSLKDPAGAEAVALDEPYIESVVGRYLHVSIEGRSHRIYFEEAGDGVPLICLHTAGADGRQYRAILNDRSVTDRFRVIVFDLPWHGKSSPPAGFGAETYQLTTERYVEIVMAIKSALCLDNPVVMGCSIGGRAVLHLALRHGDQFRAAIGLQSAAFAKNAISDEGDLRPLNRGDVHAGSLAGASMASLTAPQSPESARWETMWHYMQGGPGVFLGDLYYYFVDGDLRNGMLEGLDVDQCPVYLLTGEYDYSATPALTQALAEEIGATHCEIMQQMGHFPMSENPAQFRTYLLPVLDKILAQG